MGDNLYIEFTAALPFASMAALALGPVWVRLSQAVVMRYSPGPQRIVRVRVLALSMAMTLAATVGPWLAAGGNYDWLANPAIWPALAIAMAIILGVPAILAWDSLRSEAAQDSARIEG